MAVAPAPERTPATSEVRPQPGPQELFASTPADVAIIGGSVFGGKTWSLVVEPLRHIDVPGFTFVAFRREMPEITNPGGMWDEMEKWYPAVGGRPRTHVHEWDFPARVPGKPGASGKCAGLQYEKDLESWLGAQVCLFLFDQLETFAEKMFFFMLSRNRSTCGVQPYVRASANPDPDSFLVTFLAWWIDSEGWAIPARSGVIRWFVRIDDTITWASVTCSPEDYDLYEEHAAAARAELVERFGEDGQFAKSVTFVLARLQDNAIGRRLDPAYEGNVRALARVERMRLLGGDRGGNWKIRATAGLVFDRAWFKTRVRAIPTDVIRLVRYWDKAATQGGGKFSAGVLMGKRASGRYIVLDVECGQWSSGNRETVIKQKAQADQQQFGAVTTWVEQEPGSGGKESAENTVMNLAGFTVRAERVTGDKVTRANPLSAQAEVGNVDLLDAPWNEPFLAQAHRFDGKTGFSDQIDAAAGAFNKLSAVPDMPAGVLDIGADEHTELSEGQVL
jgi:predicted phage terminase large subunit-like protein